MGVLAVGDFSGGGFSSFNQMTSGEPVVAQGLRYAAPFDEIADLVACDRVCKDRRGLD